MPDWGREDEIVLVSKLEVVDVRDEELVPVLEELAVPLGLDVSVPVKVLGGVLDADEDGDAEALRRLAMLRPRYVIEDTAASASPNSHSVDS